MAKAKDKEKKSGTKAKKGVGTKLAKTAKKSGLMDLINTDLGREILADALIAAAGAAAAALTKTRTAKKAGAAAAKAGEQGVDLTQTAAGAVAGVVTEAARHFLPARLVGEEAGGEQDTRPEAKKVRYVQRSSDHSKRKTSKAKAAKSEKSDTAGKA
ncbi:hypothetical protein [Microvirga lotononidis]|uniref:Uncharacterized protein n=1 Tax=Microvirga lotononidis TaxID=864069 RepID=I4YPI3_9HYPH|nr:hypothetical protein [Microvirga lotononidis]EIM25875.1 hypothetical protein MicloDRAFT_00066040 [Microvirga lotononidis]WQO25795.1 hypothetical protein U0023_13835 [Microvirga lotononidis]